MCHSKLSLVLIIVQLALQACRMHCIPLPEDAAEKNPIYGQYFEGDMRFPVGYDPRNGIIGEGYRWPNKTVPYTLSDKFANNETLIIAGALAEISNKTCLRFRKRVAEEDFVFIDRGQANSGCWSYVGHQGGKQVLNLQPPPGPHCIVHGTIAHEMTHALGFFHEQSRTDRDDYVTIKWENIPTELQYNFEKYNNIQIDTHSVRYDYGSLMHYNAYAFAIDASKPTIVPKINVQIGQSQGLSEGDVQKIRRMYNCSLSV